MMAAIGILVLLELVTLIGCAVCVGRKRRLIVLNEQEAQYKQSEIEEQQEQQKAQHKQSETKQQ